MFVAIILVFILGFGVDPQGCSSTPNYVAEVNGKTIPISEYRIIYGNLYEYYQRMIPNFTEEQAKKFNLQDQAFNELVIQYLLAEKAEEMGFHVGDKEVGKAIVENRVFQKDGKFDKELYNRIVQFQFKSTIKNFEEKVKRQLLADNISKFLRESVDVSEKELQDEFVKRTETADLSFITFSKKSVSPEAKARVEKEITDSAVTAFLGKNAERVKKYFDDHKSRYEAEEKVRASHILIKVDDKTKDADAKKKIEKILVDVKAGKDFAELAKANSQDGSAPKGGDLGFFGKKHMVPAFSKAAFELKKVGDVSDVVRTPFGYHIIKLTARKSAEKKAFENVKSEIAKEMITGDKFKALFEAEAKKALSLLRNGQYKIEDIKKDFPDWNLEEKEAKGIKKTNPYIAGLGYDPEFVEKVFAQKEVPGYMSEPKVDGDGATVVKVVSHVPADMKKFQDEKEAILRDLKNAKSGAIIGKFVEDLKKNAKIITNKRVLSPAGE